MHNLDQRIFTCGDNKQIMNQLHRFLSYKKQGIQRIRSIFIKKSQAPQVLKIPQFLLQFFKASKNSYPIVQSSTSKYNVAMLIQWAIQDISDLNTGVFSLQPSCLNIACCLLKLMQIILLIKIFNTPQAALIDPQIRQFLQEKLEDGKKSYKGYCNNIKQNSCNIISQNFRKSLNSFLEKRLSINIQVINSLQQLQISGLFSNIILNCRRQIHKNWKQRKNQIKEYFQPLKRLEVKLYYLSISVFPGTEPYLRKLSTDVFDKQRTITYSYLIHESRGLQMIYNYFDQATLQQFERDMDLISNKITNKQNRSQESIPSTI